MPKDDIEEIRSHALELNRKVRNAPPITPPNTPQSSLDTVLKDPYAHWKFSGNGAGGASLVTSDNLSSGGSVIKIEQTHPITSIERSAKLMDEFFQRAQGPLPFAAPRVKVYKKEDFDKTPGMKDRLDEKLDEERRQVTEDRTRKVDNHKRNLDGLATNGSHSVLVMEFGQGDVISSLNVKDKEALVRSDDFARAMGRAMAPSIALMQLDHIGTKAGNMSNVMYDPDRGQITLIDYEPGLDEVNGHALVGVNRNNVLRDVRDMRTFLEQASESPEAFEAALDKMCSPQEGTPFNQLCYSFMNSGTSQGDCLFLPEDQDALNGFSMPERRRFAANILKGAIEGLQYMQQNVQALEQAVDSVHEIAEDGTELKHFYDGARMNELKQEFGKVNVQELRAKMDHSFAQWEQRSQEKNMAEYGRLQAKLAITNRRIHRIENNPTRMDRIKAFFSRRHREPIDLYHAKRENLEKQLHRLGDVPNYPAFQQKIVNGEVNTPQPLQVRAQLTNARRGGPQSVGLGPPPNYPPPQVPNTTASNTTAPKVPRPLPPIPTGPPQVKVSDMLKSGQKSTPPPDTLRNRTQPRVRDNAETKEGPTEGQGHGTGNKTTPKV